MGTTVISQYIHRPNTTELGLGNTHETYLLVGTNFDLSSIFTPGVEVNVIDSRSGKTYALKAASGSEFRINQMGPIYKDYQVAPGDEIAFTAIKRGKTTHIFFTVNKFERVIFYVDKKGVEINNIEKLEAYTIGEREYRVNYSERGNTITADIKFKEAKKKRADSPNDTDFYEVSLNGTPISAGTHFLTLGEINTLSALPKSIFNTIEVNDEDYNSENTEILNGGNKDYYNPNDDLNHVIIDILDEDRPCDTIDDLKSILNNSSAILTKFSTKGASNADSANFALLKYYKLFKKLGINTKKDAENLLIETNLYPQSGSGSGVSPLLNILNYLEQNDFLGVRYYETNDLATKGSKVSKGTHKYLQTIYFGSPGTGKSFMVKNNVLNGVSDDFIFRTTFHPDTDYASFVGCYKPITNKSKQSNIAYTIEELADIYKREVGPTEDLKTGHIEPRIKFGIEYCEYFGGIAANYDANKMLELAGKELATGCQEDRVGITYVKYGINIGLKMGPAKNTTSITYDFAPQTFTNAYVKAWQNPTENVYLVIEEINRGNCAQIFGDLFQLLDRDDNGISEYPIKADADLTKYLQEKLSIDHSGIADGKIKLPGNLSIIATMNTSDQSLFPMDSAFKRRWEWKYVPTSVIGDKKKKLQVESKEETVLLNREQEKKVLRLGMYEYDWSIFLEKINKCITDATHSDDKQLGFWFVKTPKDSNLVNIETFVSKVIFYLWTDVFKDFGAKATNPFAFKNAEGGWVVCPFSSFFDPHTGEINLGQIHGFMYNLGIIPELEPEIQAAIEKNIVEEGNPEA